MVDQDARGVADQTPRSMADQAVPAAGAGPTERVPVRFEGDGAGAGELTWGQRELWEQMRQRQTWMPVGGVLRLPPGTTVADVAADLRFVMSRYPSMRTRLRFDPDGPRQVVAAAGELELEVVDAADGADPARVAIDVWLRYWQRDYDFTTEWPVRMAVVRHRGVPDRRVWMMCHLVTDGIGGRVILQELADRDRSAAGTAMPPLAQARWQGSPAGQRQCQAALRHWEKVLRAAPAQRFPPPDGRPPARYWQARLDSPAMHLAVRAISERTGVESASVLLAVFAVAQARVTGRPPVVTQVVASNRFRPGLARTVSPIAQNGLCAIEVPDTTVDDVVTRTRRRAMVAYKHAYYDPTRRDALIARVSRERGKAIDLDCVFNDRRLKPRELAGGPPATPERIRAALPDSRFEWTHQQDQVQFDGLSVNIEDVSEPVQITMPFDTHRIAPSDVEACLRGMEEVAVAAGCDPAARTRLPPGTGRP
jgi:hypothetical protein